MAERRESLATLARALDAAVRIPGTNVRVGLDALIGLVPGVGDVAGAAIAGYIVLVAARRGAPPALLARMLLNVAVDTAVGAVPVVGDLFDVAWRANTRNVQLLERHGAAPTETRAASRLVVGAVLVGIVLLLVGGIALAWLGIRALARA